MPRCAYCNRRLQVPSPVPSHATPAFLTTGCSQGAALAARTIEKLPTATKDRIGAVVLFGYTQNLQLKGGIPDFPQNKIKVFCNVGDLVCVGTLTITAAHLTYGLKVNDAVDFIVKTLGSL